LAASGVPIGGSNATQFFSFPWLAIISGTLAIVGQAGAQTSTEDFVKPRLVLNGQGHTASVRTMAFSSDGNYLLSGGLDKVVHVWEFRNGRPRLDRTIRPPINRKGGSIYALALTQDPDAQQQRLLAVAGYGVSGPAGDILIYRIPGLKDRGTGDLAFHLPSGSTAEPITRRKGHAGVVLGLAFSPDGRYLASCGEDATIRIWDVGVPGQPTSIPLIGHVREVGRVAFQSNDVVLSGGGEGDGTLRLWHWRLQQPLVALVPPAAEDLRIPVDVRINALVVSRDGHHVVVGRENGKLERYDAADLANGIVFNPDYRKEKRAVEALAYSPDGKFLATSILKYTTPKTEVLRPECEVAIRSMPEGGQVNVFMSAGDLVRALAFSPDARFLAVGGGEFQAIAVRDLQARPDQPMLEMRGPGTALWSVAFVDNKPTLAYARQRRIEPAPWQWEGFDLSARRFVPVTTPDRLQGAVTTYQGWTVEPDAAENLYVLNAISPQGQRIPIPLDRNEDLRWTSYTFIPPNAEAGHPNLAVAVGSLRGSLLIHRLTDGQRTRLFLGHSGAINGLAPSADGRWLASASADQTVRLWTLAGSHTRPALGATFDRDAQGVFTVKEVARRSFAQEMGLKTGDRIDTCYYVVRGERVRVTPDDLIRRIDTIAPGTPIGVEAHRAGQPREFQTTRRDSPVLSLFPSSDHEWVTWMPEGDYDTSIAGDQRLLGWHVNKGVAEAAEFYPMSRYEDMLRHVKVIDTLLQTADPIRALEARPPGRPPPDPVPPPKISVLAPVAPQGGGEIVVQRPSLDLRVRVDGSPGHPVQSLVVRNGSRRYPPEDIPAAPTREVSQEIDLQPGENAISMVATDNQGVVQFQNLRVRLDPPKPPEVKIPEPQASDSHLVIRSIGIEKFQGHDIPPIKFAEFDARKLKDFLVAPADKQRFRDEQIDALVINGPQATAQGISNVFDGLAGKIKGDRRTLRAGDTVFLVIESHVLNLGPEGSLVLGANAKINNMAGETSVPAREISARLEEVASEGCLVLLFLDGIHEQPPGGWRNTMINDWVRDLNKRGVIVLLASKQEPSQQTSEMGVFAQAVLDSVMVAGTAGPPGSAVDIVSPTLYDFQAAVVNGVRELTGRKQFADYYPPDYLDCARIRIFEPQRAPLERVVKR
jgi:WD40 repeat protein